MWAKAGTPSRRAPTCWRPASRRGRTRAWALCKMEEAWPEEHLAKLSVNALIGLWARNVDQYCAVARIRQMLAEVPVRCCLGLQGLPKKYWTAVERLTRLREQVEQLRGHHFEPEIQAWPRQRRGWERVEDPVAHCLQGRSLLLTGLPGTGKTHLARRIVEQLREAGDVVQLVSLRGAELGPRRANR